MKKPEDNQDSPVNALAKKQLDDSLEGISDTALERLAAARQQAVLVAQKSSQKRSVVPLNKLQFNHKPMWAMAASVCLAVPIWYAVNLQPKALSGQEVTSAIGLQGDPSTSRIAQIEPIDSPLSSQSTNLTQLDIMTNLASLDEEELEILEDLEFALWLQEEGLEGSLNEQDVHQQGALGGQSQSAHG